jgi:hypothetical protein
MFTLQFMPAVREASTNTTPRGVVQQLEQDLVPGNAKHLLTIYGEQGGHAITPIAVDRVSASKARIAVYDNNWPGDTRYVHVNTQKNTWSYRLFGTTIWHGNKGSKTLQLADPGAGLGHQPCFICAPKGKGKGVGKTMQLKMTGDPRNGRHGAITVTDQSGASSGCGPDGCFNRIKGAELMQPLTKVRPWRTDTPPTIDLPTRNAYEVELGSTSRKGGVQESVKVIGRGFSVGAERIRIAKGETDSMKIGRRGRGISFVNDAHSTETPRLVVTTSSLAGGKDYSIAIEPVGINRRASLGVRFNADNRKLRISNPDGSKVEKIGLTINVFTKKGETENDVLLKVKRGGSKSLTLG